NGIGRLRTVHSSRSAEEVFAVCRDLAEYRTGDEIGAGGNGDFAGDSWKFARDEIVRAIAALTGKALCCHGFLLWFVVGETFGGNVDIVLLGISGGHDLGIAQIAHDLVETACLRRRLFFRRLAEHRHGGVWL